MPVLHIFFQFFGHLLKDFIYLFIFREGESEGEREKNINVCLPLMCPPTGDLAHIPGMCLDWESNWQFFGLQADTQSTEPHQLELFFLTLFKQIVHVFSRLIISVDIYTAFSILCSSWLIMDVDSQQI